ncbi:MAG: protocatechuate 3,4-dioxygenase subunit beta [Stackebrandtia sp.]
MNELAIPQYKDDHESQPALLWPDYRSTRLRAPSRPPVPLRQSLTEITGPLLGGDHIGPGDADLTSGHPGEPLGQRIVVSGRVTDSGGRPVPRTLVEVWQANAAGRYVHDLDRHPAPLDPNFTGAGSTLTDDDGLYRFVTVKPGCYPWKNHHNAWRPAHIHFSLFGRAFVQRLVTQMYFPDDPLFDTDPVFGAVADTRARQRMIARFDPATTVPEWALGFHFDIVLRGRESSVFEGGA